MQRSPCVDAGVSSEQIAVCVCASCISQEVWRKELRQQGVSALDCYQPPSVQFNSAKTVWQWLSDCQTARHSDCMAYPSLLCVCALHATDTSAVPCWHHVWALLPPPAADTRPAAAGRAQAGAARQVVLQGNHHQPSICECAHALRV